MSKQKSLSQDLISNRKARHLYHIEDTIEAGMELKGAEVKSLRENGGSIKEAYVVNKGGELFVIGMTIPPYSHAGMFSEPMTRDRKLLLHRREIDKLSGAVAAKGMTLVPLKVYTNNKGIVKMKVGLAKGKDAQDKRQDLKEKTMKREMDREYKVR